LIEVYFDGLCQPINPGGISCYAFIVKSDGRIVHSDYGVAAKPFSEESTNNVAEYTALAKALQWLLANNFNSKKVEIKSDSQLVVNQLTGDYKVKARRILPLFKQVLLKWIPRDKNREADRLTNKAYNNTLLENPEYLDRLNNNEKLSRSDT
jgi:ribonuclease HI